MTREQVDAALTVAFQRVFGVNESNRSPEQRLVLARFRQLAKPETPQFKPHESDRTLAMRCGRLEMWLEIDRRCTEHREATIAELLGIPAERTEET
jgi:hypothetical protein